MSSPYRRRTSETVVVFLAITAGIACAVGMAFNLMAGERVAALACLALLIVDVLAVWVTELSDLVRRTEARRQGDFDDLARAVMLSDHDAYDRILSRIGDGR